MKAIRLENSLYERLLKSKGPLGKVEWIYPQGFYVLGSDGQPIYFQEGKWLDIPFSIVLDCSLERWIKKVFLTKGDHFFRKGSLICRWPENNCHIRLLPEEVINLNRALYNSPPGPGVIKSWIQYLTQEILSRGQFEGMGGSIVLLKDRFSELIPLNSIEASVYSRYAFPDLSLLLRSTDSGNLEEFLRAWERIVGLGLGLTPSGDDVLVGFLASHKILSSDFWKTLDSSNLNNTLIQIAVRKTTPVASEFLRYALNGIFSETLYHVFETLPIESFQKVDTFSIQEFLNWGHTSGTDTLVGVILGLSTISQEHFA